VHIVSPRIGCARFRPSKVEAQITAGVALEQVLAEVRGQLGIDGV
jgi:hypothetical protein